ncbi:MAG: LysR family transcriptional regulator, partial [Myxococcaceae bacterium]|nr:LysR family transcriptional regulator [Myxococcaceae bacterium]
GELDVSPSAVSQAVRALEAELGLPLLSRTTRSVAPTEAGARLLAAASPALRQLKAALESAAPGPDVVAGKLRLNVPSLALRTALPRLLREFHRRHPRVALEVVSEDQLVDIVADGFDAGVRLSEAVEQDMVAVQIWPPFAFGPYGSPTYLEAHGTPKHPRELKGHACIAFRSPTTGKRYHWELERGGRSWRVAIDGPLLTNGEPVMVAGAVEGLGLAYLAEPTAAPYVKSGQLTKVLGAYHARVPGLFLYFPSRSQMSPPLKALVEVARTLRKG